MGSLDTFYLDGAVALLADSLDRLGSDARIDIVPGKDHGTILGWMTGFKHRREMAQAYLKHHPPTRTPVSDE